MYLRSPCRTFALQPLCLLTSLAPMNKRPNVLVFFTDQQRHDSTGVHGNPLGLTPNFDRIARQHTHVANSFTCQPVCGPARSCLQTGQYATTTGCWRNSIPLDPHADTIAKRFKAAGYRTGYIGKWHLYDRESIGPVPREARAGYDDWLAANILEWATDAYQTRLWNSDDQPVDLPGYRVDAMTDAAIRYIDQHQQDPFFLFLSYLEPHHQNHVDDYPAPDGYREQYDGRWTPPDLAALPAYGFEGDNPNRRTVGGTAQRHLGGYWGMIKRLDEAFGRILDALKSLGLDRDTIILFTSDHACHFKTRNGEYKRSCHENSIRVPTLLAGPGFEHGGSLPQLVSLVDLPPTLLDAAGLDIPDTMEGRSLMPLIRRQTADWPEEVFVQISESHIGRAVRTRRWKYAVAHPDLALARQEPASDHYIETELYDLQHDPWELNNLIDSSAHAEVRQVMRERLLRRIAEVENQQPTIEQVETPPPDRVTVTPEEARA